jgi:hypothetical protein
MLRRSIKSLIFTMAAISFSNALLAQGTFQNLDFEDANIVPIPGQPFMVTVANGLPDWTVEYGNVPQTLILLNQVSLGGTEATLIADGYPTLTGLTALDGNFSILLYGGPTPISISQIGQIPFGTQSLLFEGNWFQGGPPPEVSIGGDNLALFSVKSGVYGANISAWAGQTEQLSFTVPSSYGPYEFDDISFSPVAVPEPSVFGLTAAGLLFALYRRVAPKWQSERRLMSRF